MGGQGYMVSKHSTDFLGFAERQTAGHRETENEEHLEKLLVHAFLEDLRIAYRRRRLWVLPRRVGFRRTAYIAVLLNEATTGNGGRPQRDR
ncbi:hypothetical protein [Kibdelosporangium phytohabitans]|nr:hypothetical protein [Kibdelosporangium phytohabitans]MBE1470646.1 hypothetical protein [Kibdelosporangium phytohabitans]